MNALTRSLGSSYPKTDDNGNEIYYRFVETGLTVAGTAAVKDKKGNFIVEHGGNQYIFTVEESVIDPARTAMGTVTNTLRNETAFKVVKSWQGAEQNDELWIEVELFRDGAAFPLTEKNIEGIEGAVLAENGRVRFNYKSAEDRDRYIVNLPLYDEQGSRHSYTAFERACTNGYHLERSDYSRSAYTIAGFEQQIGTVSFLNVKSGSGESLRFEIIKVWQDDADTPARSPVTAGIYYHGGASPELVQAVTLSDENCWTADIRIPLYKSEEKDKQSNYSVVEISNEGYGWTLPTDEAYLESGSTEDGAPAALKKENKTYAFKVTTDKKDTTDHNSLTVITNTRVGGVELALKKTWNMGAEPTAAVLRLVQYDNDGKPTALAGVTGKSGETALTTDENGEFTLAPPDNAVRENGHVHPPQI